MVVARCIGNRVPFMVRAWHDNQTIKNTPPKQTNKFAKDGCTIRGATLIHEKIVPFVGCQHIPCNWRMHTRYGILRSLCLHNNPLTIPSTAHYDNPHSAWLSALPNSLYCARKSLLPCQRFR